MGFVVLNIATYGGDDSLRLAKAICCLDPDANRKNNTFNSRGDWNNGDLGDCCGLIYGRTGVCHQMANRICAAATEHDDNPLDDLVSAYEDLSKPLFDVWGKQFPVQGTGSITPLIIGSLVPDDVVNKIPEDSAYRKSWSDYLNYCKSLL